jgi:hypothetical protein
MILIINRRTISHFGGTCAIENRRVPAAGQKNSAESFLYELYLSGLTPPK